MYQNHPSPHVKTVYNTSMDGLLRNNKPISNENVDSTEQLSEKKK